MLLRTCILFILFCVTITACGGSNTDSPATVTTGVDMEGAEAVVPESVEPAPNNTIGLQQDPGLVKTILASSASSQSRIFNPESVIPAQCYTKTESQFNPCHTCHQFTPVGEGRANRMDDGDLQGDYGFSDVGVTNHWLNLFEDRSARIAAVPDEDIINYVNQDNYSALAPTLESMNWTGWIPDLANLQNGPEAFDENGFAKDGSHWVAFNYMPLPSTFWPTNGATDDVMIRLPPKFREFPAGNYNQNIYILNLSALEAAIKNFATISIPAMSEIELGFDIDGDEVLEPSVTELKRPINYFGAAINEKVYTFLYPEGTAFLHTVRYIGVDENDDIFVPKRMKEVRYMVKTEFHRKSMLGNFYAEEQQDKFEGNLPRYPALGDKGIDNKFGWQLIGFIENAEGELRQQVYEENLFCMGCHTTIGTTIDQTFSFARKIDGAKGWGYINLKGMKNVPVFGRTEGSITEYLKKVGGGNEFRGNEEMQKKYFPNGQFDQAAVEAAIDVYELLTPSRRRALDMNKAYRTIVEDQDFIYGRDVNIEPFENVFPSIDTEVAPLEPQFRSPFDIRLDWSSQ